VMHDMLREYAAVLSHLQAAGVVHGDMKYENLVFFENTDGRKTLKAVDMGNVTVFQKTSTAGREYNLYGVATTFRNRKGKTNGMLRLGYTEGQSHREGLYLDRFSLAVIMARSILSTVESDHMFNMVNQDYWMELLTEKYWVAKRKTIVSEKLAKDAARAYKTIIEDRSEDAMDNILSTPFFFGEERKMAQEKDVIWKNAREDRYEMSTTASDALGYAKMISRQLVTAVLGESIV